MKRLLGAIIATTFRRSVSDRNPNEVEQFFADKALALRERGEAVVDEIVAGLYSDYWVEDREFRDNFVGKNDWSSSLAKFLLERYQHSKEGGDMEMKDVWLEHILPQNPQSIGDWGMTDVEHRKLVDKIGNLTLVGKDFNREMSNHKFSEKKPLYKKSDVHIAKEIAKFNQWTEKEISERTNKLADFALKVWAK